MAGLGDDDVAGGDEAAGGGAGGLHQRLPGGAVCGGGDGASGLGRADGFIAGAGVEETENGLLELVILG